MIVARGLGRGGVPGAIVAGGLGRVQESEPEAVPGIIGGRRPHGLDGDELERLVRAKWDAIEAAREADRASTQRAAGAGPAVSPAPSAPAESAIRQPGAAPARPAVAVRPGFAPPARDVVAAPPVAVDAADRRRQRDEALLLLLLADEV